MPSLFEAYGLIDNPAATPEPTPPPRTALGTLKDVGVSALKGAIGVPEAAVGLLDIVTGGAAGQALEGAGFRPKEAKAMLDEEYSPAQKTAFQKVQAAQGLGDTFMEAIKNPSVIAHSIVESLPSMGAGAVVARGGLAALPAVAPALAERIAVGQAAPFVASQSARSAAQNAPLVAGALGEGVVGAGSAAEQIRQETPDGTLTGTQSGLAALSGVATAGFGLLGGKIAQKLDIADVDTMLAGAARSSPEVQKSLARRVLEGAVSEGLLEELPQSISEQVIQNMALGKPLDEGLNQAAVLGLLSGAAMGGGPNLLPGRAAQPGNEQGGTAAPPAAPAAPPVALVQGNGPLSRAANSGIVAAQQGIAPSLTGATGADLLATPENPLMAAARVREEDARQQTLAEDAMAKLEAFYQADMRDLQAQRFEGQKPAQAPVNTAPVATEKIAEQEGVTGEDAAALPFPQPGDILNQAGEPFKGKGPAMRAAKKTPGEVLQVFGGWIVRPTGGANVGATAQAGAVDSGTGGQLGVDAAGSNPAGGRLPTGAAGRVRDIAPAPATGGPASGVVGNANQINGALNDQNQPTREDGQAQVEGAGVGKFDSLEDALTKERDGTTSEIESGWMDGKGRRQHTAIERAVHEAVTASVLDADAAAGIVETALKEGRADLALYAAQRAARAAESMSTTPGVSESSPKYEAIKNDLVKRKQKAQADAQTLIEKAAKGAAPATAPKTGDTITIDGKPAKVEAAGVDAARAAYAAAAEKFNAMIPKIKAARDAGDQAEVERLKAEIAPYDIAMRKAQAFVQNAEFKAGADARLIEQTKRFSEHKIGRRVRPSEFPAGDIYWQKDADNSWSGHGAMLEGKTATNTQLAERGGLVDMLPATNPPTQAQAGTPAEGAGESRPAPVAAPVRENLTPEKQKALDRIARGTAYFSKESKAKDWLDASGLTETHEVVQHESGANRWDVRAKKKPEPHEQTFAEFDKAWVENHMRRFNVTEAQAREMDTKMAHLDFIEEALEAGKTVNPKVLEGYGLIDPKEYPLTSKLAGEKWAKADPGERQATLDTTMKELAAADSKAADAGPWDSLTDEQKTAVLKRAGWSTEKGELNFIGKRLLKTAWANITEGTRATITKNLAAPVDEQNQPQPSPDKRDTLSNQERAGTVNVPPTVAKAIQDTMERQKSRVMRLRREAEAAGMTLDEKAAAQTKLKAAETSLRKMRTDVFKVEDAAIESVDRGVIGGLIEHADLFPEVVKAVEALIGVKKPDTQSAPAISDLTRARNLLMELQAKQDANGMVGDDRLETQINQIKREIQKLEAADSQPTPAAAPAPAPTAAPAKPDPLTEQEKAAKAKMLNAAGKLATLLSKNTRLNITPEQEQQMLPIVIELFEGAMELGYVKFKQAARYVREFLANAIDQDAADSIPMDTLQGAYIATARRHADKDITPKKDVISVDTIADLDEPATNQPQNEVENAGPTADTAGKDIPNDRATDDATREGALDQVAPGENGAAPEDGTLFGGNAGGGQAGSGANGAAAGGRVPGARGGRGGAGRARTPATGGRRRAGAVGTRGTGPDGSQLSAFDEGLDPEQASAPNIGAQNYRITEADRLGQGGEVQKFNDNIAAIRVLKTLDAEQRRATPGEQRTLARYVGWGGLPSAFPNPKTGAFKDGWDARGKELRELLDDRSYDAAKRSTLDAHYTSETVVRAMWSAVARLGFKGGLALESSMGSGNFLGMIPQEFAGSTRFVGVEYDATTARVAEALYPQETVLHAGFHKVPVPDNTFALNIGNPPFGAQSLTFQFKPELAGVSIHNQFFRAAMDALRPGGVQALVVSRFLLDAQDKGTRLALAKQARLLGAIRLPDTAFKENARTEVVTDIIFLQKLAEAEQNEMAEAVTAYQARPEKNAADERERRKAADKVPAWVETGAVADPLGGEKITLNQYFKDNPRQILGVLERSGSMQHGADVTVRLDDKNALAGMLADAIARLPEDVMNVPDEVLANTEARFKSLSDSLRIQLNKEEPGHLKIDLDGKLQRVLERETPEGDYEFMRQEINADSPWSEQLYLDAQGRWYRLDVALDEKGEKKKIVKNGKVTKLNEYERVVFQNEADIPATLRLGEDRLGRLTQLVRLRDYIKRQLMLEAEDKPEAVLEASRKSLRSAYEAFVKAHGPVNRPANAALVGNMPDGGLVLASELNYKPAVSREQAAKSGLDPREESVTPAPIMARRVVPKYEPPTKADSASDALIISLSERGRVDLERMAALVGKTEADIIEELQAGDKPLIFKDPESGQWETSNAYLSGNVRKKLIAAKAADIPMNVKALEAVQPAPWTADQVTVMLGSAWVPPAVYAEFYEHITGGKAKASYSRATNTFSLGISEQGPQAGNWSSEGATAQYILSRLLNSQPVLVMTPGTREEGPKVDQEATAIAQLKAREMVDEFGDWVFRDATRRANLTEIFNDRYNTRVTRQHDGSHLTLPGKVPDGIIAMRRHQKNAIWRGIAERFMLIDHAVGAGKTFTGIARAIERRRMGLSKKPMIVVPNHLVEQWAADVYRLYPGAKVLAASSKDFDVKRRRRLFAKIATGDWDIVIVPHSSFAFIGVAPETEERFLREELRIAKEAVEEAEQQAIEDGTAGGRGKPFGVKEAERLVEKIQGRLDKLGTKKDRLLTFEQMGVDDLTVDEAHEFKNLFYSARLTGVRGMGNKTGSQKAFDLYNKVRVLRESPTGSVTFMTGTPISNSAVEMFTMLRYLAADELRDMGMEHFDAWRAQFVEATSKFEPTESGRMKEVTRLGRSWSNMRSLMDLYYGVTDAVTNEDIQKWYREDKGVEFPIPKVKGGERQLVAMKPTEAQLGLLEQVMSAFDSLPGIPDPYERNKRRLRLMNVARSVSLDVRSIGRDKLQAAGISTEYGASPEKGGKLERVSEEIKRIYDKWTPDLGTQLVFLDRSVPKSKGDDKIIKAYDALQAKASDALDKGDEEAYSAVLEALEKYDANEIAELRAAQAGGWNAYQQLKDNLVAQGIPAAEIRFVQEADDDAKKKALFDAVNGGKVRVLIGSTPRMGAGTNVQQRLVGLHHVDVTWKPSDIEQREGRIIRQPSSDSFSLMEKYGTSHEVEIIAYATERTVDAKMWDLNATKLKMINGIRKYDGSFTMEFEDEDSVSMAEMAALASGDPLLLERVTLESQISALELLERGFRRNQYSVEDQVRAAEKAIKEGPSTIQTYKERAALAKPAAQALAEAANDRKVTIEGKTFNTQFSATAAATEAIKIAKGDDENKRYSINVNGVGLTNKEAIAEAIADSLGDVEPFQMTVRGATYIRRTPAAKAITELVNEARKKQGDGETIKLGEVAGLELAADLKVGEKYDDVTLVLRKDGQTLAQGYGNPEVKTTQFTAGSIRGRIEMLLESLEQTARGTGDWAKERMEQAERDLPGLRERMGQKFPKAEEIEEKRRRLAEVIGTLSGAKAEAADAVASEDGSTAPPPAAFMRGTPQTETKAFKIRFLRGDPAPRGAKVVAVQQFMDSITEKWSNAPTVIVAANMEDPLVPKAVRDYNASQMAKDAAGAPMGFFYGGKVYVLADSLNSPQDALTVLAHEALGHYGLRGMFGDRLDGIKGQIIAMRKKEVLAKVKAYGLDPAKREDLMYAAEEVLAKMAQTVPSLGFVKRAVAIVRQWLRENIPGFGKMELTDDEIINQYIVPARGWVVRGRESGVAEPTLAFMRNQKPGAWRSELFDKLAAAKMESSREEGWRAFIQGLTTKGVKPDEIEWSGVTDWLKMQPGKVTKQQVLAYLDANGVQVQEVVLGSGPTMDQVREKYMQAMVRAGEKASVADQLFREMQGFAENGEYDDAMKDRGFDLVMKDGSLTGNEIHDAASNYDGGDTKYRKYTLPGGENYREVLLTLPEKPRPVTTAEQELKDKKDFAALAEMQRRGEIAPPQAVPYRSKHWDTPNVLAHIRLNDRTDADGKRVLFVEEIQSDWGQEGKKQGFDNKPSIEERDGMFYVQAAGLNNIGFRTRNVAIQALNTAVGENAVPLAPFVTSTDKWLSLALKRIITMAAQEGYDRVAFVNGQQSAERFSLDKELSELRYEPAGEGLYEIAAIDHDGVEVISEDNITIDRVEELVGKEMAEKIANGEGEKGTEGGYRDWRSFSGDGLKIEAKGMRAFYDQIVPTAANKLLAKLGGGKVETVRVNQTDGFAGNERKAPAKGISSDQLGFTITPAMREKASAGLPLFRKGADQTTGLTPTQFTQALSEAFGAKVADRLQAKGVVVPLADQNSLPAHVVPYLRAGDVVFGFYDPRTDRTYAVLENLTPDMVKGLALHEVGVHYGFEAMLGADKYKQVMKRLDMMHAMGSKAVRAARAEAVKNAARPAQVPEETLAYLVQNSPELGLIKEVIAKIKAFLFREFGIGGKYLTEADLHMLAKAAVQHAARTEPGGVEVPAFMRASDDPVAASAVAAEQVAAFRSQYPATPPSGMSMDTARTWLRDRRTALDALVQKLAPMADGMALPVRNGGTWLVSREARPDGSEWRITRFDQNMVPQGHEAHRSAADAVADLVTSVDVSRLGGWSPEFSRAPATDTKAFKDWFGDSKVVDAEGKPLVVYHGTNQSFSIFDREQSREGDGVVFATPNRRVASDFAKYRTTWGGANVMPVYVKAEMVLEVHGNGRNIRDVERDTKFDGMKYGEDVRAYAARMGYDAIVFRQVRDPVSPDIDPVDDVYALLPSAQIKSAIGNNGNFDPNDPDIRFMRSSALQSAATERVADFFSKAPGTLSWWHKTIGTQYNLAQRSPKFRRVFNRAQDFLNDVSRYATEAADLAPKILPKLETWRDIGRSPISAEDNKAIAAPIFEGTLKYSRDENGDVIETDDVGTSGVVWTDAELRSRYNLTNAQIGLYREFRKATDKSLTNLAISDMLRYAGKDAAPIREAVMGALNVPDAENMLVDYLQSLADGDPERGPVLESTIAAIQKKAQRAGELMQRGYAPLSRFGQHTLDVVDASGERVYFGLFESAFEAKRMARKMLANFPGAIAHRGTVSQEEYKLFAGVSPETLELFGDLLGLESQGDSAADQAFQTYLKAAKANRSSMKRLIHRKGTAGFSEDAGRVLAGFIYSNARQTGQNLHLGELTEAAEDVNKGDTRGDGQLKDQATKLVEYIKNPVEEAQAFRGLLFAQYLGGSVASALVNMTQPVQVTFPYLSQFGGAAAAANQMKRALSDVMKSSTGDARLDAALKLAEEEGIVAPQEVHQLMAQAEGKGSLKSGDGTLAGDAAAKASNVRAKLALAWGKFFGAAEQFNRRVTFIAAYRTAVAQGIPNPAKFAEKTIAETQFVYNKGNKPNWARGAVGSTLFTFKQYSISYVELMNRMWQSGPEGKKAVLLAMGMLFLMGGAGGLPFVEDVEDLVDGAMQRLGYNFQAKQARRQFFERILGKEAAKFAETGISGLPGMPIDVSGRMGMGNLIPGTGLLVAKADHTRDATEVAGAAGDFVTRMLKGADQVLAGDITKGAATVSPTAARNAVKALEMYSTGQYKDEKGRKVLDVDGYDAMAKAIGFQPADVANVQQSDSSAQRMVAQTRLKESQIADRWAKSVVEGDQDGIQAAREMLRDWNEKNPDTPIRIAPGQIAKRVQAMRMDRAQRIEKSAPKEIRATVRRELEQQ